MLSLVELILVGLVLTNLVLLGTSRIGLCIRMVAFQGVGLALLPLLGHGEFTPTALFISGATALLKGWIFPLLLFRSLESAHVRAEVEPYVGYSNSLLFGVAALAISVWLGSRMPLPGSGVPQLLTPVAFFTILVGLFGIVTRRKAVSQVVNYLVLENGIFAFGAVALHKAQFLVEMGILLDVFVAVFVMGIAIFRINREFDHIDADRLALLKE
ncbi:MAG: hydrogenase-4 component E [Humidesulfovibrio sp.]|nr:hydrogenase-4 component E [Humidesulfovibrio sp.]